MKAKHFEEKINHSVSVKKNQQPITFQETNGGSQRIFASRCPFPRQFSFVFSSSSTQRAIAIQHAEKINPVIYGGQWKTFFSPCARTIQVSSSSITHTHTGIAIQYMLENAPFHFERGLISILLRALCWCVITSRPKDPSHAQGLLLLRRLFKWLTPRAHLSLREAVVPCATDLMFSTLSTRPYTRKIH